MKYNDHRKKGHRNTATKTIVGFSLGVLILWYFGVKTDFLILGLLSIIIGIFTYFMLDYDEDIEDIKKEIMAMKNNIR